MVLLQQGRIVMKLAGREGGRYAVIVEPEKDGFVTVSGPKSITGIKRRKCSIFHVEPTEHTLAAGSDAQLEKAWKESGLIETLGIQVPEKRKGRQAGPKPTAMRKAQEKAPTEKKKQ